MKRQNDKLEQCRAQITAWGNRAAMAAQQGNRELEQIALERKRQYQNELAKLEEFQVESEDEEA